MTARLLSVLLCIGLGACSAPPPARHELYVLHTLVEVTLPGADAATEQAHLALVETTLRAAEARYTAWGDGELARANAALARGETVTVSAELAAALLDAQRLSALSGGRFDPGVGRLVEAWGFHADERPDAPPPDAVSLGAWRADRPGIADLRIEGTRLSSPRRDLWLDLGAYAKGRAVDEALAALRASGARAALIAAAGDICALGDKHGAAWRVGIRDPRGAGVAATLPLADGECVSTSGDYERTFVWEGQRYHHLLDPQTGMPAVGVTSLSVIAARGALADVTATAALIGGPAEFHTVAQALGVTAAYALTPTTARVTRAMHARLQFAEGAAVDVVDGRP